GAEPAIIDEIAVALGRAVERDVLARLEVGGVDGHLLAGAKVAVAPADVVADRRAVRGLDAQRLDAGELARRDGELVRAGIIAADADRVGAGAAVHLVARAERRAERESVVAA